MSTLEEPAAPEFEPAAEDAALPGAYTKKVGRRTDAAEVSFNGDRGTFRMVSADGRATREATAAALRAILKSEKWQKSDTAQEPTPITRHAYTVDAAEFRRIALAAAMSAVKTPKAGPMHADRPVLTGIYLEIVGPTAIATAADGFALTTADADCTRSAGAPDVSALLRGDQLAAFAKAIKGAGSVTIRAGSVAWAAAHYAPNGDHLRSATLEPIDGTFPGYHQILPDLTSETGRGFEANALAMALKPVAKPAGKDGASVCLLYADRAYGHRLSAVANTGAGYDKYVRWLDADAQHTSNDADFLIALDAKYLTALARFHAGKRLSMYATPSKGGTARDTATFVTDSGRTRTLVMAMAVKAGEKHGIGSTYGLTIHREPPIEDVTTEEAELAAAEEPAAEEPAILNSPNWDESACDYAPAMPAGAVDIRDIAAGLGPDDPAPKKKAGRRINPPTRAERQDAEAAEAAARMEESAAKCPMCGTPCEPADKFCAMCGARLDAARAADAAMDAANAKTAGRQAAGREAINARIAAGAVSAGAITPEEAAAIEEDEIANRAEALTAAAAAVTPARLTVDDDYAPVFNIGKYSPRNQLRIYDQFPGAYEVRGFHQWLAIGRCVKKGEKGIGIAAPVAVPAEASELTHAMATFSGATMPDSPKKIVNVKPAYVFDWTQTRPLTDDEKENRGKRRAAAEKEAPAAAQDVKNATPFRRREEKPAAAVQWRENATDTIAAAPAPVALRASDI